MAKLPTKEELRAQQELQNHAQAKEVVGEITPLGKPDNIPADVWEVILDNGRIATERLNEILRSPRFRNLRAGDQAKLIKLAQDRAYGAVAPAKNEQSKSAKYFDLTADEMKTLTKRAQLPEYKLERKDDDDA